MSSIKNEYPVTWLHLQKLNKRIPERLNKEQDGLAKKFRKPRSNPFTSLTELYQFFDAINIHANGLIACKKGCSHCCHMEVGIYQIEADFIAEKTGCQVAKLPVEFKTSESGWIDPNRPCPFLKSNACSVYEFRPMVCRTHVSYENTNELCRVDDPSPDRNVPLINRKTSFPGAMKAYEWLVVNYGGGGADIRDFFGQFPLMFESDMSLFQTK